MELSRQERIRKGNEAASWWLGLPKKIRKAYFRRMLDESLPERDSLRAAFERWGHNSWHVWPSLCNWLIDNNIGPDTVSNEHVRQGSKPTTAATKNNVHKFS